MIENVDQKFKKKKNKNFRLTQSSGTDTDQKRPEEEKELKTGRNGQAERRRKGGGVKWTQVEKVR